MRYVHVAILIIMSLVLFCNPVTANTVLHGEIIEVFAEQNKVRVLIDGKMDILVLSSDVEIYRQGDLVSLVSARPITDSRYQEGLFFCDDSGCVTVMIVDYSIEIIQTPEATTIIYFDIFGNIKDIEYLPSLLEESAKF